MRKKIRKMTMSEMLIYAMDNVDEVIYFSPDKEFQEQYGLVISSLFYGNSLLVGRVGSGVDYYYNIPDDDPQLLDMMIDIILEIEADAGKDCFTKEDAEFIVYAQTEEE